jgi:hypothetical protein
MGNTSPTPSINPHQEKPAEFDCDRLRERASSEIAREQIGEVMNQDGVPNPSRRRFIVVAGLGAAAVAFAPRLLFAQKKGNQAGCVS